jgi:hypothetical protein
MPASNSPISNNAVFQYLHGLADSNYWGSVSLRMEGGRIVHLYKEESIKPEALLKESPTSKDEPLYARRNVPE